MLLAIDVGTTNVKVVLVEEATFSVLDQQTRPLGSLEHVETPGAAERSVSQIFHAIEECVSSLETAESHPLREVKAIGVCGQMHGCVLWNSDGSRLFNASTGALCAASTECSNLFTWQDSRCDPNFISSLPKVTTGGDPPISAGYGCATLAWLQRHDPETLSKYDRAGTIMDLVVSALTSGGNGEVVMSSQNATSWGYFNLPAMKWHTELLEGLFPAELLPRVVVDAPHLAGVLVSEWHQIPRGTKVAVAMGDLQCSVFAVQPHATDAVLNMGSASQLVLIKPVRTEATPENPSLPRSVVEVPYFSGSHLLVAAALGGGDTIALFIKTLQSWLAELLGPTASLDFQDVYKRVMESANDKLETTLQMDPRVWGERHAPEVQGRLWNLGHDNLTLGDVSSAMVRGLVENLRDMISPHLLDFYQVKRVLGSGKLLQRHRVFQEHVTRVFELPLVLKEHADAPLGAAMAVAQL